MVRFLHGAPNYTGLIMCDNTDECTKEIKRLVREAVWLHFILLVSAKRGYLIDENAKEFDCVRKMIFDR